MNGARPSVSGWILEAPQQWSNNQHGQAYTTAIHCGLYPTIYGHFHGGSPLPWIPLAHLQSTFRRYGCRWYGGGACYENLLSFMSAASGYLVLTALTVSPPPLPRVKGELVWLGNEWMVRLIGWVPRRCMGVGGGWRGGIKLHWVSRHIPWNTSIIGAAAVSAFIGHTRIRTVDFTFLEVERTSGFWSWPLLIYSLYHLLTQVWTGQLDHCVPLTATILPGSIVCFFCIMFLSCLGSHGAW